MSGTRLFTSLLLLGLVTFVQAQEPQVHMLGSAHIKGEIRHPGVAIIPSRITPKFRKMRVEKSFMTEIKYPETRITDLDARVRYSVKMEDISRLLRKPRSTSVTGEFKVGNNSVRPK